MPSCEKSAKNVARAIDDFIFKGVSRSRHILQQAVIIALKNDTMAQIPARSKRIIIHFNHCGPTHPKTSCIAARTNLPGHQFVQNILDKNGLFLYT